MSRTHGRKPLPLPELLQLKLHENRFVQLDDGPEPRPWRTMKAPNLRVWVVRSNMPGSDDVVLSFGTGARRMSADQALGEILLALQDATSSSRPMGGA